MSDTPGGPDWFKAQDGKWYPPAPQVPQFAAAKKKGGCLKGLLIGFGVIVVLIILVSVGSSISSKKTVKTDQATCAGKTYPDQQKTDICADSTGTATLSGMSITATALISKSDDIGDKALCTNVTMKNTTSKSQDFNVLNFKMQTPSGVVATDSTLNLDGGTLNSGTLIAGASTSGAICTDDTGEKGQWILIYKPNPFESTRATWLMNVS